MYRILAELGEHSKHLDVPCLINYKAQLANILVKNDTAVKGRITQVHYHNAAGDKVLDVDIVYNDDTGDTTYPLSRVTTRRWYDDNGANHDILGFDKTVKTKLYDVNQTVSEGQTRRKNIINKLFAVSGQLGYQAESSQRMREEAAEVQSYIAVHDTTLITDLHNDTTHTWLNDPFALDTSVTLRQVMIANLTI